MEYKSILKWTVIYIIAALVLYGLVYYFFFLKAGYSYAPSQSDYANTKDWKTYSTSSFEYKYPPNFSWGWADQPLWAIRKDCNFDFTKSCPAAKDLLGDVIGAVGISPDFFNERQDELSPTRKTYNDNAFCVYGYYDGAAGTSYLNQYFVVEKDNSCTILYYITPYPNCQNYLPLESGNTEQVNNYNACIKGNEEKPKILESILSTFKFIEK